MQIQRLSVSLGEKLLPLFIIAIHFSPAATLVFSILIALFWLASGHAKHTSQIFRQAPATFFAVLLLAALALSVSYSSAPYPQAFGTLSKYRELLLLLILVPFLSTEQQRARCENYFLATLLFTMLISLGGYFQFLSAESVKYLLKNHITHSLFMAFLAFYCMHRIYARDKYAVIWAVLLGFAGFDLFVISDGRMGQLAYLLLCALFFVQVFSLRTALLLSAVAIVAFALFLFVSPYGYGFRDGIKESMAFFNHAPNTDQTSMGARLRFWNSALSIIAQSPFFGEGIGGFPIKFHELFPSYPILTNPHNEYLLITSQLGIPGLILFLTFLASILWQANRLAAKPRFLTQGLWLMLCVSCLFNSSILDHSEGHWFMTFLAIYAASLAIHPATSASDAGCPVSIKQND